MKLVIILMSVMLVRLVVLVMLAALVKLRMSESFVMLQMFWWVLGRLKSRKLVTLFLH